MRIVKTLSLLHQIIDCFEDPEVYIDKSKWCYKFQPGKVDKDRLSKLLSEVEKLNNE